MRYGQLIALVVAGSLALACSKNGGEAGSSSPPAEESTKESVGEPSGEDEAREAKTETVPADEADPADEEADAPGPELNVDSLAELEAPEGVPPLDLKSPGAGKIAASRKLNTAGYRLHKQGKHDEAAAEYHKALSKDPGNLLARYNLAGTHLRKGEASEALALLKQIKDGACRVCLGVVIHSRGDEEWAPLHDNELFKELTADVEVSNPDPKVVMKDIMRVWRSENDFEPKKKLQLADEVKALIHPRRPIRTPNGPKLGAKAFHAYLHDPVMGYFEELEGCKDSGKLVCCSFSLGQSEDNIYITRICLKKAPGGVLYLHRFEGNSSI